MTRRICIFVAVLFLALTTSLSADWPWDGNGSCSPATDLFTCLSCASNLLEMCEHTCPLGEPLDQTECGRNCITDYRGDLRDCHDHFDPIYY